MPAASPKKPPESLGLLVRRFFYAMRSLAEDALRPTGFSMPQFAIMRGLRQCSGQSAADLARKIFVTPQAMGEILAGLEQAGCIRRTRGEGRKVAITLTRHGELALDVCNAALLSVEERMLAPLHEKNRDKLGSLLNMCLANISQDVSGPSR